MALFPSRLDNLLQDSYAVCVARQAAYIQHPGGPITAEIGIIA